MPFSTDAFRSFAVAFVAIAAVVAVSCDKVPLTSPTGSTISLVIDKNILPVNGQATVIATVIESAGTAVHNGTTVSFLTTLGTFTPPEAQTVNGRATVIYNAPNVSGTATINAFSGGSSTTSGNSSSGGVQVLVGTAAVGTGGVSINVAPATVPQNGGTVTVSARVLDSANNPLPNVAVTFTTDQGTLASTTAVTNASGTASTQLTTNRVTKVAATVGAQTKDFTVNVVTAPTITIEATTTSPVVGVPVAFRLTPSAAATANPIQTVVVNFGDGTSQTLNGITGPIGLTHTYNRADGYTVTATATDINGVPGVSSVAIVVSRAQPTVSLTVPTTAVLLTSPTNGIASMSVTAAPATGGPPLASVIVRLADGTVLYTGTGSGAFIHKFTTAGSYVVQATVTDAAGTVASASAVVVVQ